MKLNLLFIFGITFSAFLFAEKTSVTHTNSNTRTNVRPVAPKKDPLIECVVIDSKGKSSKIEAQIKKGSEFLPEKEPVAIDGHNVKVNVNLGDQLEEQNSLSLSIDDITSQTHFFNVDRSIGNTISIKGLSLSCGFKTDKACK